MAIKPKSKPQITREEVLAILKAQGIDLAKEKIVCLGLRGYYKDTMGKPGVNDVGIYDDAFVWIDETDMATFNGNTDPSRYRSNVATLAPGKWRYKKGNHGSRVYGPYPAFRQADKVTVLRYVDGKVWKADTGLFGINKHRGEPNSTSSLGCQTTPPDQWEADRAYGYMLLARHKKEANFLYLLVDMTAAAPKTDPKKPEPELPKGKMHINKKGVDLIKSFEGCYLKAYLDPVGIPTIGWGTIQYPDGKKVKMGDVCTQEEADNLLMGEIAEKEKGVLDVVKVELSENQFAACVSFAYNLGVGAFKGSTLLKKLNAGAYDEAALEFPKWNKAGGKVLKGLTRRRAAEQALFVS